MTDLREWPWPGDFRQDQISVWLTCFLSVAARLLDGIFAGAELNGSRDFSRTCPRNFRLGLDTFPILRRRNSLARLLGLVDLSTPTVRGGFLC